LPQDVTDHTPIRLSEHGVIPPPPPFLKRTTIPPDTNWYCIDSNRGTGLLIEMDSNLVY